MSVRVPSIPGFALTEASEHKRIVLAFRLQTVLVVLAILSFSNGAILVNSLAFKIAAVYLFSNGVLILVPERHFRSMAFTGTMFVVDVSLVSTCIHLAGSSSGDLFLLYFLAILMAALTRDLRTTVLVALFVSAVYLWASLSSNGMFQVASPEFLLRIPLFFATSFFTGFLANQARQNEIEGQRAKAMAADVRQQLEETKRLEEQTPLKYGHLYQHHENIMTSINSGIVVIDKEGVITTFNREAENITGLSALEVVGRRATRYPRLKSLTDPLVEAYEKGKLKTSEEAVMETGSGPPIAVGFTTSLLRDQDNDIAGAIATFRDLSETKELRDQIKRSEHLAFLGEMAASVAHEIRNPLDSLSGFAQLLRERIEKSDRLHSFAEIIVDETKRIEKIVAQTLHFVKDDTIPFEPVDLNQVITSTAAALQDKLASKSMAATLDLNPHLPHVMGNEVQLRQVCTNLVANAIDATETGGSIRITTTTDGETVKATVEDNGCGVPSEIRENIFNPFFTTKTHGTGLGLAVSHKIVGDHGGTLRLVDKRGKGALFEIELPPFESAEAPGEHSRGAASTSAAGAEGQEGEAL